MTGWRRSALAAGRGRAVTLLLAMVSAVGLFLAARDVTTVLELKRQNQIVRDLAANRDVPVSVDDGPDALHARFRFLADRGMIDQAEALMPAIVSVAPPSTLAAVHQALGNARLLKAFEAGERQSIDDAVPEVALAKDAYRRALAADPSSFDLKVNLDLAMRLVRDFPEGGDTAGEEDPDVKPKNLWSELPGVPEGLP